MRGVLSLIAALPAVVLAAPIIDRRVTTESIPNSWIVRFDQSQQIESMIANLTSVLGIQPKHTYNFGGFRGAALEMPDLLVNVLEAMPFITYVERDAKVKASTLVSQSGAPWGLSRISRRAAGQGSTYVYDDSAGVGTFSYIIDTVSVSLKRL